MVYNIHRPLTGLRNGIQRVDSRCLGKMSTSWHAYAADGDSLSQALQPNEGEVEELRGHVVIAGFGRVGQIIGQLLSERLIPFVALDVRSDRVQVHCLHCSMALPLLKHLHSLFSDVICS